MQFWSLAYKCGWVSADQLKQAVTTEENPFGEITPEQYKSITGKEFAIVAE